MTGPEPNDQQDLFGLRINAEGRKYLQKFGSIVRIIILFSIVISAIYLISTLLEVTYLRRSFYSKGGFLGWRQRIMPVYITVYTFIFGIQIYFYWKTAQLTGAGISGQSEEMLNAGFRALYRHAVFGMITLLLTMMLTAYDFYLLVSLYLK